MLIQQKGNININVTFYKGNMQCLDSRNLRGLSNKAFTRSNIFGDAIETTSWVPHQKLAKGPYLSCKDNRNS